MYMITRNARLQNNRGPLYRAKEYSANSNYNIYDHQLYIYHLKSDWGIQSPWLPKSNY